VFYESSHRIVLSVNDLLAVFGGERKIVLAREISKIFETIHNGVLNDLPGWLAADLNQQKGEFVLVLEGAATKPDAGMLELESVLKVLLEELPLKQASQIASKITGIKKNTVYRQALEMSDKGVR